MSTLPRILAAACMLCMFSLVGSSAAAQVPDGDWLTYNRTLAGDRFSPLREINRSNVAQLKAICTYTLPEVSSLQTGPLVVDGTMYFTTDEGSYAINASTCAEKWKYHRHSDTPSALLVNRGFAYANGRLFRGTSDSHVLAMDPADGHVLWDHVIDAQGPGVSTSMGGAEKTGSVLPTFDSTLTIAASIAICLSLFCRARNASSVQKKTGATARFTLRSHP